MTETKPAKFRAMRAKIREALFIKKAELVEQHREPKLQTLSALNHGGKHVYAGTVPQHVIAKRRAANKRAKASRRANRH